MVRGLRLTPAEHQRTLARAVVVVHVFSAEVGAVDGQTALSARRPAVALQEQPETEGGQGRRRERGGKFTARNIHERFMQNTVPLVTRVSTGGSERRFLCFFNMFSFL